MEKKQIHYNYLEEIVLNSICGYLLNTSNSMQQMVSFGLLNPLASTSSFNVLPNFHNISCDQNCWFCQMSNKYSPLM